MARGAIELLKFCAIKFLFLPIKKSLVLVLVADFLLLSLLVTFLEKFCLQVHLLLRKNLLPLLLSSPESLGVDLSFDGFSVDPLHLALQLALSLLRLCDAQHPPLDHLLLLSLSLLPLLFLRVCNLVKVGLIPVVLGHVCPFLSLKEPLLFKKKRILFN